MKKNNINKIKNTTPFFLIIVIFGLSLGFAAFTSTSSIIVGAKVEPYIGIQIINASEYSTVHNGASNYETNTKDEITSGAYLPYEDSEITYEIDLANLGTSENGIYTVTGLPSNLEYSFSNYTEQDKICDQTTPSNCAKLARRTIYMTVRYKRDGNTIVGYNSNVTTYPLDLTFDFRTFHNITYTGFSGSYRNYIIDGGSLNITFNSGDIPSEIYVTGATNSYQNPTLSLTNVTQDVGVHKKYTITYVLDGGTQAAGQITSISSVETYTLLNPTKTNYSFGGWYDNSSLTGNKITTLSNIQSNITLYAKWNTYDYYLEHGEFNGQETSVINTGIMLYSEENVNKNFRIAFTIDNYNSSYNTPSNINNNKPPTIISSMVETASPYDGFVFRFYKKNNVVYYSMKINDSHVTSYLDYYALGDNINVEIARENGSMYLKINSNVFIKVLDYDTTIDTFDVPLTIGGNINGNGNYDRFFDGSLSNVIVEFYEGNRVNDFHYTESRTSSSYNLDGTIEFDGTNYIDTGLNLFSSENINKDFDISLTIDYMNPTQESQATLINGKDETQNNVWPGFAYRCSTNYSASNMNMTMTSRWPGETTANLSDTTAAPKTMSIIRRSGVISYSINGGTYQTITAAPAASLNNPFVPNLTFGASLDSTGAAFRAFKGIVSDISVQLSSS